MSTNHYDLPNRMRRLRKSESIRRLVNETQVNANDLIQPLFVVDGNGDTETIDSMPGILRYPVDALLNECEALFKLGICGIALFPKIEPSLKSDCGDEALKSETLVLRAIRAIKKRLPDLLIFSDIALDPYTAHGHDGILNSKQSDVDNDATIEVLSQMAVLHAEAGADFVAPSDMMDGRIGAIRDALDTDSFEETGILAYSAKFASAYYGPFRDAVGSTQDKPISKAAYQLAPGNRREAMREALLDEEEHADILMVKPAGPYLDIIRDVREQTDLPVAAYQVSGEYAQIHAAAMKGWLDYSKCRDEALLSIKRAGADMILSYFAKEVAQALK